MLINIRTTFLHRKAKIVYPTQYFKVNAIGDVIPRFHICLNNNTMVINSKWMFQYTIAVFV